jgi:hypothetical protein
VALIVALGSIVWWVKTSKTTIDEVTLCPTSGPKAIHVIIFDRSDPISPQQGQQIRQAIDAYRKSALAGYRFDLYTFQGNTRDVLEPVLQICSPGNEANELYENPDRIRRRYDTQFVAIANNTIDALLRESTQDNSPIIESIRAAAITSFGSVTANIPLRMTLISDMVQNTRNISQIRSDADLNALLKNPLWPTLRPSLKGAQVDIMYLLRPTAVRGGKTIQNQGHQIFWENLISAGGGQLSTITPL